jgi:hypothetical protein
MINSKKSRSDTIGSSELGRSDTNSIEYSDSHYDVTTDPLPPAHRAVVCLNSLGVPSFSQSISQSINPVNINCYQSFWNISEITYAMRDFYRNDKTDYESIAQRYFQNVKEHLIKGILIARQNQLEQELIPLSWNQLRRSVGRYGSRGNQQYWFDWFQANCPLIEKVLEGHKFGNKGTLTMVKPTFDIEVLLASQDPNLVFDMKYGDLKDQEVDWVPINLRSLGNYIKANRAIESRDSTLDENLKLAKTIRLIAASDRAQGQLPQIVSESDFGRRYYKGINLQSAPKIVRHAALGNCHQYDIEASVFTWKFDLVKSIDPEIKLPYTLEYLEFKNHYRKKLAQTVFSTQQQGYVNYIKRAFTAVGFGARKTNTAWQNQDGTWSKTALRYIIKSREKLDLFLNDPWVKGFIQEQDTINKIIWDDIKSNPAFSALGRNKGIAKAYQMTERVIIEKLMNIVKHKQVLLLCHDGFYTRQRCNLAELRECLQSILPSGRLDHEEINAYKFVDNQFEQEHQQHMEWERQQARLYAEKNGLVHQEGNGQLPKWAYFKQHNDEGTDYFDGSYAYDEFAPIYEQDDEY